MVSDEKRRWTTRSNKTRRVLVSRMHGWSQQKFAIFNVISNTSRAKDPIVSQFFQKPLSCFCCHCCMQGSTLQTPPSLHTSHHVFSLKSQNSLNALHICGSCGQAWRSFVKLGAAPVGQTICLYVPVASDSSIFHYYV